MGRTVDELLDTISARELTEWQLYAELEPLPAQRFNLELARLNHTLATIWSKEGNQPKLEDFFVFYEKFAEKMRKEQDSPSAPAGSLTGKVGSFVASKLFKRTPKDGPYRKSGSTTGNGKP